jgi:hypothetical protein
MQLKALIFILTMQSIQISAWAQVRITSLELGTGNKWLSYSFPLVHSSNKSAEQKINYYLQSKILDNDTILTDTKNVFEKAGYINQDSNSQSGYSGINYDIEINNSRVLSLIFQMESTGAYSENFPANYNFNTQTGNPILIKDIFTPNGIIEIKKILIRERKKRIMQWIREMDTTYNIKEDSGWIYETFAKCNTRPEENNLLIKGSSIVFCKEYCFSHVARPYDTDLDIEMMYVKIKKYLSEAGKRLLMLKN